MPENSAQVSQLLLAVYGTLKEGFSNYFYYLHPKKPIFSGRVLLPYEMYLNKGIPALYPAEERKPIVIEVFEISEKTLRRIDRLEGVPFFYNRIKIFIEEINQEVFLYVIQGKKPSGILLEEGNFNPPQVFTRKNNNELD